MDNTYIKLFRKMLTWEWYGDTNTTRVFLHILLKVNYEPSKYRGHEIGAGECVFGRKKWAKELGLSERQVRTAIEHLKSTNEVTTKSTNKFTIIHLEKWEFWQIEEGRATNRKTNKKSDKSPTSDQQPTTSKESKNIRNTTTPTIEEVRKYVEDNNLLIDADYFWKYYETAEWKDAKGKPVKNWKLKALNWNRRESNDDRRSNGERTEVRTGSGVRNATDTDSGKTVWKRFKTMEDVLQENQRCESDA
jgi:hypothetical protein